MNVSLLLVRLFVGAVGLVKPRRWSQRGYSAQRGASVRPTSFPAEWKIRYLLFYVLFSSTDGCVSVITNPVIRAKPSRWRFLCEILKEPVPTVTFLFHCLSSSKFPPGALRGFSHSADDSRNACKEEPSSTVWLVNYNLYSYYK